MIHPHTQLQYTDDHKGYGVFATRFLPKGTITYVKDSLEMEISPATYCSVYQLKANSLKTYTPGDNGIQLHLT